jgi:hypothetical protein
MVHELGFIWPDSCRSKREGAYSGTARGKWVLLLDSASQATGQNKLLSRVRPTGADGLGRLFQLGRILISRVRRRA